MAEAKGKKVSAMWVKRKRTKAGITRQELARRCGCTQTLVWIAEQGRPIHPLFATKIARELGASERQAEALMTPPARSRWKAGKRICGDEAKWASGRFSVAKSYKI